MRTESGQGREKRWALQTIPHELGIAREELRKAQTNMSALAPPSDPVCKRIEALFQETSFLTGAINEALDGRNDRRKTENVGKYGRS